MPIRVNQGDKKARQLAVVLATSLGGGLVFHVLDLPVAWLLGPMLAGVATALLTGQPVQLPVAGRAGAQIILGVAVGTRLSPDAFAGLGRDLPWLLLLVVATAALSMLNGYLLSKLAGIDPATGFLGSVPGAASAMIAMSAELDADPRLVAVLQYLRVLLVALLVPFFVENAAPYLMTPHRGPDVAVPAPAAPGLAGPAAQTAVDGYSDVVVAALLVTYAGIGWYAGTRLRLPSASFLGPFILSAAGSLTLGPVPFPDPLFNAALLVLGTWIGVQFDGRFVRSLGRIAFIETILVVLLVVGTGLLGAAFSRLTGVGLVTALLASSPGAMEAMVVLSLKLGAQTPLVIAMQMLRFLSMLLTGPWIAKSLIRRVKKETA